MPGGPNPNAWNNWYHGVGSTYGTWIRGDPRGFRTFGHRQHIEGDYRNPPPPGVYAPLFEAVKTRLRYDPVYLTGDQRSILCHALTQRLEKLHVQVVALTVMSNHFHLLARFPQLSDITRNHFDRSLLRDGRDPGPRHLLGLARKHASHVLRDAGRKGEGPVWAARPKFDPIRDRAHQVNVAAYIRDHLRQGGVVCYLGNIIQQ